MKTKKLSIFLVSLVLSATLMGLDNPLKVDAGLDKVVCVNLWDMDTVTIGGNPTAIGGDGDCRYFWETENKISEYSENIYFASRYLNDTSIANPKVINRPTGLKLNFKVTVKDEGGNAVTDSVNVYYSKKKHVIGDMISYIGSNDSVLICSDQLVGSTLPLDSVSWQPIKGLTNPHSNCTWAKPESDTYYTAYIRDTAGCYGTSSASWIVVRMTNIKNISFDNSASLIYYNSKYGELVVDETLLDGKHFLSIYDLDGRIIYTKLLSRNQVLIQNADNRVLIYNVIKGNELIETGKILNKSN